MTYKLNCRVKMSVIATRWQNHGDHPQVLHVPEGSTYIEGYTTDQLGMLPVSGQPGSFMCFPPHIWIIDSGGHTFTVTDDYFVENYDIIDEIKDPEPVVEPEVVEEPVVEQIEEEIKEVNDDV